MWKNCCPQAEQAETAHRLGLQQSKAAMKLLLMSFMKTTLDSDPILGQMRESV
jgi:hypothetical protein